MRFELKNVLAGHDAVVKQMDVKPALLQIGRQALGARKILIG
jgi:hypothetical protein